MMPQGDAEAIAAILTRYEDAIRRRDADAIVADFLPGAIAYDMAPPLFHTSDQVRDPAPLREWFDSWEDDLRISHTDAHVHHQGDLGVLHCLQHMEGTKKGEAHSSLWFRTTAVAKRDGDTWRMIHLHTSVPMAMDGSGKALVDLEP